MVRLILASTLTHYRLIEWSQLRCTGARNEISSVGEVLTLLQVATRRRHSISDFLKHVFHVGTAIRLLSA